MRAPFLTVLISLLLGLSNIAFSQATDYRIRLVNETFLPEEYGGERLGGTRAKGTHAILQFYAVPSPEERAILDQAGIVLGDYIPNYAYVASFTKYTDMTILRKLNLRTFLPLDARFKLSPELFRKAYPEHCLRGEYIRLQAHYYEELAYEQVAVNISPLATIQFHHPALRMVEVELPLKDIEVLMCIEEVKFLEPIHPEPELENTIKNTSGRTNWLNTGIGGLQYDGAGATVGVEEGGRFDPAKEPELRGRMVEVSTATNISGHKTNVAADHMGSAGNLVPINRSIASGADVLTQNGSANYQSNFSTRSLVSVNHSYGYGIGTAAWATGTTWDGWIRDSTSPTHTWSAGNQSNTASNYGPYSGLSGFANLTGGVKQAKNTFTVGSLVPDDVLAGFSSKGPTYDGRIKPDLVVEGAGGTSYAAPKISGTLGVLTHAYKGENGGTRPHISLLKAILLNTCDDLENPGPDFRTGYGRVNARRAFKAIKENRHLKGVINHGGNNSHTIMVPANVKELRVLIHWPDYRAASSLPVKALVNDLDLRLVDPSSGVTLPWILNPAADLDSLRKFAVRGVDTLNNAEQVTISNPAPGTYTAQISGTLVPQGPQDYYLTYEFLYDELTLTYPIGKEHFVPGETERIKWDSYGGTGTFDLEYSTDSGLTFSPVVSGLSSTTRNYAWSVPNHTSGKVILRVRRGSLSSQSVEPFNIMPLVNNLQVIWACGSNVMLKWDAHPNATHYRVTRLGAKYMDSIGVTSNTYFLSTGNSTTADEYFSVQAYGADGALSRRVNAVQKTPGDVNCTGTDVSVIGANLPSSHIPSCLTGNQFPVMATIQNTGTSTSSNIPVRFQLNGGTIYSDTVTGSLASPEDTTLTFSQTVNLPAGTHTLKIWTALAGDGDASNDTLTVSFTVYASNSKTLPYTQNFDTWTGCSTAWGCAGVSCTAEEDWLNIPNVPAAFGDSIDWRTDRAGTGTGSTGPSADHTSGNGNYLYLEGSGNNGSGCQNKTALLNSPCFDLSGYDTAKVSFWYHMYGSSIGELHLDLLTESGLVTDVMIPRVGEQGNQWLQAQVDISAYVGQRVALRFRATTGSGFRADLAIDDIFVEASVDSCANGLDQTPPTPLCQHTTLYLDGSGNATLTPATIDGGSTDNCILDTLSLSQAAFTCADLGPQMVHLIVPDVNGNVDSCTAVVTVVDTFAISARMCSGTLFNLAGLAWDCSQQALQFDFYTQDPTSPGAAPFASANASGGLATTAVTMSPSGNTVYWYRTIYPGGATADKQIDVTVRACGGQISITAMLEGPFNATTQLMRNNLQQANLIPLVEPYSGLGYSYANGGSDSTSSAVLQQYPIVDWVVVEVRDSANPAQILYSRPALLRTNGSVVDVDGFSPVAIPWALPGAYHVAVYHRNHLAIMSATAVQVAQSSVVSIDLSDPQTPVYGTVSTRKVQNGKALMFAGDADGNGQIQNTDDIYEWQPRAGLQGYLGSDYDLNTQVQNSERVFFWITNVGRGTAVP